MADSENALRVVGWAKHSDPYFPACKHLTEEVIAAVAEDIRAHGYIFGGDAHGDRYDCAPVLSDGTLVSASSRAWAHIMAVAHDARDERGEYFSAPYDADMFLTRHRYPDGGVDFSQIADDSHDYAFNASRAIPFDNICAKKYELRPFDALEQNVCEHDYLSLIYASDSEHEEYDYRVTEIIRAASFAELIAKVLGESFSAPLADPDSSARQKLLHTLAEKDSEPALPFDPIAFGFPAGTTREKLLELLRADFPYELTCGAVCFRLLPSRKPAL